MALFRTLKFIMVISLNLLPFNTVLSSGKIENSHGAKCGEQGGCEMRSHFVCRHESTQRQRITNASIVTLKKSISRILLSVCFHHTFPRDAVTCQCTIGGIRYILVEHIHNAQHQKCFKKTLSMLFTFSANLFCLFLGVWR